MSFNKLKYDFHPFPNQFTVMTYLPKTKNPNFYGAKLIYKLVKENPEVNFIILGHNNENIEFNNVKFFTINMNRDISDLYERSSVLLRLTKHDGLSSMVLESLARGRHVIWTSEFPYTYFTKREFSSIQIELNKIRTKGDNRIAMNWVYNNYNSSKLLNSLEKYLY